MPAKLTVMGSADAFNSAGRGSPCHLVEDDLGAFCVDFGPTALMELKRRRFAPERLDAVFLTHLHGDHFGGLHLLLIDAQYRAFRERPLTICGPRGTERHIEAWYKLAYGRSGERRQFETLYRELAPGEQTEVLGRRVQTFRALHKVPRDGALQLRISTGGAVLAFTGDSAWTDELPALAAGADVLVSECTELHGMLTEQHLSWQVLRPRFDSLEARRIVLAHLGPEMRRAAHRLEAPRVVIADDGYSLTVGSKRRKNLANRER
ncbi:MAG TPA: hypothetical protein DFS52_13780 [Myxococcales bacterium]|nr:hypothetical protein [Myxococcales bacterium]